MITLKNGHIIPYNRDFDKFFKSLMDSIIEESKNEVNTSKRPGDSLDTLNESFLREIMDNCIVVTHQLFEIPEEQKDMSKFMVSGFIFNSILLIIQNAENLLPLVETNGENSIH